MNWDQMEGRWHQLKGSIRERFGKLTDDDLTMIGGNREKFIGKVQERYGIVREEAQKRADEWVKSIREAQGAGAGAPTPTREKTFTGKG